MHSAIHAIVNDFQRAMDTDEAALAEPALAIARIEYDDLDVAPYVASIDALAGTIADRLKPHATTEERVAMLNQHLYIEKQFLGNETSYYDPRNSCLNAVLDRKLGIPITLSLLYIEIGRRLGLDIAGVSFPGHFLVRVGCGEGLIVVDPFNGGATLTMADLHEQVIRVHGPVAAQQMDVADMLAPATRCDIMTRILRNLKKIYMESGEIDKAIGVISLLLVVDATSASEWRDRGLLYREIEAYRAALTDLSRYVDLMPDTADVTAIRHMVVELRAINARFN